MGLINIKELVLPKNVEVNEMKSCVQFKIGDRKAYLKGRNLELTNPIKELGVRVKHYSEEIIEKCHLGNVQGMIPSVADTIDLQKILVRYFKTSKSSKKVVAPATAPIAQA